MELNTDALLTDLKKDVTMESQAGPSSAAPPSGTMGQGSGQPGATSGSIKNLGGPSRLTAAQLLQKAQMQMQVPVPQMSSAAVPGERDTPSSGAFSNSSSRPDMSDGIKFKKSFQN